MADNVEGVTIEILKSIQASVARLDEGISKLDQRIEHLDAGLRKDRRNVAGMLVMMRATAGDFDAHVSEIEERVAALETRA